jgi:hypothetical protein
MSPLPKSVELLRHQVGVFCGETCGCRMADDAKKDFRNWLLGKYPQLCLTDAAKTDRITIIVNRMICLINVCFRRTMEIENRY